ncbi:extracellular solute-binding protein [Mesobacillus foraminis]|uniref:ABC transporter substrate-binding protein n=1 Tax=Mesobacillus foraminis TaxID=279826 RepID=UPI001BEAD1A4|nr:extracellular solute-binding protein [Mesobacillus foraminis]MBT2759306.1 extracellular solute-binding protein [Mesobacillus foraminis]
MKKNVLLILLSTVLTFSAAGCSGASNESSSNGKQNGDQTLKFISEDTADESDASVVMGLTEEKTDVNIELETVLQTNLMQKIQLLTASNDLPELFKFESNQLGDMIDNDQVLDLEKTFKELGLYDKLNPGAVDLLKSLSGDRGLYALPVELNIEGFWYNKKLFEENNLEVPKTWDEMMAVSEKFMEKGIQPFAVAGKEKFPITRLINGYVIRYYGADAMKQVRDGELSITDKGFVEAAKIVQDMNLKGYFGQGVNTIDYDTASNTFLQGKAAMYYMGSWALNEFNDENINKIGKDQIGFFNIPLVEGGKGTINDYSMNAGLTLSFSKEKYNEQVGEWMKEVFSNYGEKAISERGLISGFKVENMPENVSPLTQMTLEKIESVENTALWFEGYFDPKTKTVAEDGAQNLLNEGITPEDYVSNLEKSLRNSK